MWPSYFPDSVHSYVPTYYQQSKIFSIHALSRKKRLCSLCSLVITLWLQTRTSAISIECLIEHLSPLAGAGALYLKVFWGNQLGQAQYRAEVTTSPCSVCIVPNLAGGCLRSWNLEPPIRTRAHCMLRALVCERGQDIFTWDFENDLKSDRFEDFYMS